MSRRHRSQYRRSTSGQGWPDSGKENFKMLLFHYNPKYKRNIHESILIRINDWVNKQRKKRQLFLTEKFQITRAHNNTPSPSPTPAPPENGRGGPASPAQRVRPAWPTHYDGRRQGKTGKAQASDSLHEHPHKCSQRTSRSLDPVHAKLTHHGPAMRGWLNRLSHCNHYANR